MPWSAMMPRSSYAAAASRTKERASQSTRVQGMRDDFAVALGDGGDVQLGIGQVDALVGQENAADLDVSVMHSLATTATRACSRPSSSSTRWPT